MSYAPSQEQRFDHARDLAKHEPRPTDPDRICKALVKASSSIPEIVGELHALHYYGRDMSHHRRVRMIDEVREMAEQLMVSILAAEQQVKQPVERTDA